MVRYLPFLISLILTIYALFSCIQTRDDDVPHLPKLLWVLLIVLVPFVGPITWILMARRHTQRQAAASGPARQFGPGPRRTTAPDDDPEFLAWLDRNRRRDRSEPDPEPPATEPDDTDGSDDDGEAGDRAR